MQGNHPGLFLRATTHSELILVVDNQSKLSTSMRNGLNSVQVLYCDRTSGMSWRFLSQKAPSRMLHYERDRRSCSPVSESRHGASPTKLNELIHNFLICSRKKRALQMK
jgi:hypothetical protein